MVQGVDYRIPMSAKGLDLSGLTSSYMAGQQNKRQNELLELTQKQKEQEMQHLDDENRFKSILKFGLQIKPLLDAGDAAGAQRMYSERIKEIQGRGGNPSDSMELAPYLMSGDLESASAMVGNVINAGRELGYLPGSVTDSAEMRAFKELTEGMSPEDYEKARRIKAGLDPRATGSGALTIAEMGATDDVAASEAVISGAKSGASERAKLEQQQIYLPKIKAAVVEAERVATSQGEALSDLKRAQVAMPGLREAVSNLRALASVATHTTIGRVFDITAKELGFGTTEGATARAKFIAIVDNQVLPLLKQTFGAAFTVKEGEQLKATMGDPNASPEEKMAQLDAFIEQKVRDLEAKEVQAGVVNSGELSIDDLVNKYAD